MIRLGAVAETAILTLRARAAEARRPDPVLRDEMGVKLVEGLRELLPPGRRHIFEKTLTITFTRYIALRSRYYDGCVRSFLEERPGGLVVSLGCGFDTRFWRVPHLGCNYMEVDLPEVMTAKERALGEPSPYPLIDSPVQDAAWIERVAERQREDVLFLAEGLFMYLPREDVAAVFQRIANTFSRSRIVLEVVTETYTRGLGKKMLAAKMKRYLGSEADAAYHFGVRDAREIEALADGVRVTGEWSYFEDPDIRPRWLQVFRHLKSMTRSQWTVEASINPSSA